jgi:hypothetical protein
VRRFATTVVGLTAYSTTSAGVLEQRRRGASPLVMALVRTLRIEGIFSERRVWPRPRAVEGSPWTWSMPSGVERYRHQLVMLLLGERLRLGGVAVSVAGERPDVVPDAPLRAITDPLAFGEHPAVRR